MKVAMGSSGICTPVTSKRKLLFFSPTTQAFQGFGGLNAHNALWIIIGFPQ